MSQNNSSASLVAVRHLEHWRAGVLMVDWNLGNWCNYACSYCPTHLHDGSVPWHETEQSVAFVERVSAQLKEVGRTAHFQWTGGEPTVHPGLPLLARAAVEAGHSVGLISNGSRSLPWWREQGPIWKQVTLTFHVEFIRRERFFELLEYLVEFAAVHVNVTAKLEQFDECEAVADMIAATFPAVTVTLKPLLKDFGSELVGYTPEQVLRLKSKTFPPRAAAACKKVRGQMSMVAADGSSQAVPASRLVASGENSWPGWDCNIGLETLVIHGNGDIYRGNCKQGGRLGTLAQPPLRLPDTPVRCGAVRCRCLFDISTSRQKPQAFVGLTGQDRMGLVSDNLVLNTQGVAREPSMAGGVLEVGGRQS